jgi:hypothetical protein
MKCQQDQISKSFSNFIRVTRRSIKQLDHELRCRNSNAVQEFQRIFNALKTIAEHQYLPNIFEVAILDLYRNVALLLSAVVVAKQFGLDELRKFSMNPIATFANPTKSKINHRLLSSNSSQIPGKEPRIRHPRRVNKRYVEQSDSTSVSQHRKRQKKISQIAEQNGMVGSTKAYISINDSKAINKKVQHQSKSKTISSSLLKQARTIPLTESYGTTVTPISKRQSIRRRNFTLALSKSHTTSISKAGLKCTPAVNITTLPRLDPFTFELSDPFA